LIVAAAEFERAILRRRGTRAASHLGCELRSGEAFDDAAVLHDVEAVGQRRGEAEVLLDHDDGQAALLHEHADRAAERLHDHRRQALGDLVEQQQAGAGAQDARHREHLLLAAREPVPGLDARSFRLGNIS
jgi:hypothetical protein